MIGMPVLRQKLTGLFQMRVRSLDFGVRLVGYVHSPMKV